MLTLIELLHLRGLPQKAKLKLVRHQDPRFDLYDIYRRGQIHIYQKYQARQIFKNLDYIVSFIGTEGRLSLMIGVYKVGLVTSASSIPYPEGYAYPETLDAAKFYYEMEECLEFEDFKDRVVIDWGKSTRSWHQTKSSKEVIEILPTGYVRDFPGYDDIDLSFDELKKLITNPIANREWHRRLSAVSGIYLITNTKNGELYIGSAYGKEGIWGRWTEYVRTTHCKNRRLRDYVRDNIGGEKSFRFSILRTLPRNMNANDVISHEKRYKIKLGSRAFGLNEN